MSAESKIEKKGGEFLLFRLAQETYALPILMVQEIRSIEPVTKIVGAGPDILGVVNLRGQIVPILDIKARFGLGAWQSSVHATYIVLSLGKTMMGIVVDAVLDVQWIDEAQMQNAQTISNDSGAIVSIAKLTDCMAMIVDPMLLLKNNGD